MGTKKPYDTVKVQHAFVKYAYCVTAYRICNFNR